MRGKQILFFVLLPFFLNAQIVKERDVIASGGNTSASGNLQIDFTIAELSVDLLSSGYLMLSQGFNQPTGFFLSVPEVPGAGSMVFPNPVIDVANIVVPPSFTSCKVFVLDALGRIVPGSSFDLPSAQKDILKLNCSEYTPGIYTVRLIDKESYQEAYYKMIKTN